jgi:uncharacterized membrane protein YjgN (DUF898 family)
MNRYSFSFKGSGGEYFGIWLSNLVLTILTLGLYSPWAKVRREKYFAGKTTLEESTFDYTADPLKILKGRLVVIAIFVLYSSAELFPWWIAVPLIIAIVFSLPWIVTSALRFKARYSSYRNIHFVFSGTAFQTFKRFFLWKFLGIITLGVLWPYAKFKERQYIIENLSFGGEKFRFHARGSDFYKVYFLISLSLIFILCVPLGLLFLFTMFGALSDSKSFIPFTSAIFIGISIVSLLPIMLVLRAKLAMLTWNSVSIGNLRAKYSITARRYIWILISNFLLKIISLGLLSPYCQVRIRAYRTNSFALLGDLDEGGFVGELRRAREALGDQAAEVYDFDIDFGF